MGVGIIAPVPEAPGEVAEAAHSQGIRNRLLYRYLLLGHTHQDKHNRSSTSYRGWLPTSGSDQRLFLHRMRVPFPSDTASEGAVEEIDGAAASGTVCLAEGHGADEVAGFTAFGDTLLFQFCCARARGGYREGIL